MPHTWIVWVYAQIVHSHIATQEMSAVRISFCFSETVRFPTKDCEKHFRKYVRRKSDTDSLNFDTTKLEKISETNNTHGDIVLKNKKLCRESRQSII